ncbi:MAG: hypothetical protein PHX85_02475 [Methanobacteriaceae archaeon]|nr:hypothetical protein [Methanobacteriaceae archaeon]
MISVNAGVQTINDSVPTMQGWKALPSKTKDDSSSVSGVILTKKEPSAVQFNARGKKADDTWGNYYNTTLVNATNQNFVVRFEYNFGAGTEVNVRFRNNAWNIYSRMISGTWQYF